jgi:hypothetical protein
MFQLQQSTTFVKFVPGWTKLQSITASELGFFQVRAVFSPPHPPSVTQDKCFGSGSRFKRVWGGINIPGPKRHKWAVKIEKSPSSLFVVDFIPVFRKLLWIRILLSEVRIRIFPSSSKNSKKNSDFYCFVTSVKE